MPDLHQLNAQGTAADSERSLGVRFLGNARAYWRLLMPGAGLDKTVVAESIETEEQMNLVTSQGCHEGQGYLFGRPMTGNAIRARLEMPISLARWSPSIRAERHLSHFEVPIVTK
jgi:c-di-GMP-related signal transduction protein